MSTLGLGIGGSGCRAALLRGRSGAWESAEPCEQGELIGTALARLLARVPARRPRPRVVAAIAPPFAQVRRITGLPSGVKDSRAVEAAIRTNAKGFFLAPSAGIRVAGVVALGGWWWSAAFDAQFVEIVSATCRQAGFPLHGCMPSAWALGALREPGRYRWAEADTTMELVVAATGLASVRCRCAVAAKHDGGVSSEPPSVELQRSADALGAARARRNEPLLLRVSDTTGWAQRATRGGFMTVIAAGVVACLVAPAISARRLKVASERHLGELRMSAPSVARVAQELGAVSTTLDEIGRFASSRRSMLLLLAELAKTMPDSASIDALHVDSVGGTFVVVTPSPVTVLTALRQGSVETPQLAGAITPDVSRGRLLQRLPFRFRFRERKVDR